MEHTAVSSASQQSNSSLLLPMPTRNPIPLSAAQESEVQELYHKNVRQICADEIRDFALCATGRTFSATWVCRTQRKAMRSCMISHATREEQDRAREEWFATREIRRIEREQKEAKRKEQEKFHREWWGLDENGRRIFEKKGSKNGDGARGSEDMGKS